ncbi:MAG TPA: nucleotide exchange factor GrpE [Bryobacteraceae bacterium]|nr:nucleotide exchange factor GrpE [Bryobacterales bacterium]HRJ19273.1 nucleotide exchange factor GrpE [Bryobacteraceae bacterium]
MTDQELPQAESAPDAGEPISEPPAEATPDALIAERDQLLRDKADLQEMLLRRAAEFDNFRKRTDRERTELIEFAAADAVKSLLPILDDFERALAQPCADPDYAKGVALIQQRLADTLAKLGLEPIPAEGQPFDPNFHNAIEMVPSEEHEDQTVFQDLQRGYLFKGRLLRPSMVRVASRS